jgi:hypothetical protein
MPFGYERNLGAFALAVSLLLTEVAVVAALGITGVLDEFNRNHPDWFAITVGGLVVLAQFLVFGGMLALRPRPASSPAPAPPSPLAAPGAAPLPAEPEKGDAVNVATLITAATALIAAVTALSATGVSGRIQRNHPALFVIAIGLVVTSAAFLVIAALFEPKAQLRLRGLQLHWRALFKAVAIVAAIPGVVFGYAAAVAAAGDPERARIRLTLNVRTLKAHVVASTGGLNSGDRLDLKVDGLRLRPDNRPYEETTLYRAHVGPDREGAAEHEVDVHVPPGRYDALGVHAQTRPNDTPCGYNAEKKDRTGCVVLTLPTHTARPRVTGYLRGHGRKKRLHLRVGSDQLLVGSDGTAIGLRVVGLRGKRWVRLYSTTLEPPANGLLRRTFELRLDRGLRRVCAEGILLKPDDRFSGRACQGPASKAATRLAVRIPARRA